MEARLRIELLGSFNLTYAGRSVPGVHARQQALLAYLLLNRRRGHSRHEIASLFWPDSGNGQAMTNLRRELHNLRRALSHPDSPLLIDSTCVRWREDGSWTCDVLEFEAALRQGGPDSLRLAADLYQGDLLPDCGDGWVVHEREQLRRQCIDGLKALVALLEQQQAYPDAVASARRILTLEPLDEATCRMLMRLYALQGDRTAALHVFHTCARRLEQELGVQPDAETRAAYQRLIDAAEAPRREIGPTATTPPLVGRGDAWKQLLHTWRNAARGHAHVAVIRGEAGIGKTRLAEELFEWCSRQGISAARTRSYAAEGGLAYGPITDWLRSPGMRSALASLDAPWIAEVSRLLPELMMERADSLTPEPMRESWQRQHLFEALSRAVLSHGHNESRVRLLVLDDMQWCDQDTLEWLHYLLRTHSNGRVLIVGTLRTEEEVDNPGLRAFLLALRNLERLIEIDLGSLSQVETTSLATHLVGRPLDQEAAARLFQHTEGHPLFVVEMAHAGLDAPASLSPKIYGLIAARLSRLSPEGRKVAQLAATVGRDFQFDALRAAGDMEEAVLVRGLDELWHRRIIREHGTLTYDFTHDRLREVAYNETAPATRHLLHRRVAQALEQVHASDLDRVSAQLAAHCEQGGLDRKAIDYYRRAADVAGRVFASEDVIRYLSKALELLRARPPGTERNREELIVLLALSRTLGGARGYFSPEIEAASDRIRALGEALGEPAAVVQGLVGLSAVNLLRGRYAESLSQAEQALQRAQQLGPEHGTLLAACHYINATAPSMYGNLDKAGFHFRQIPTLCEPERPHFLIIGPDVLMFGAAFDAHILWLAGYPEKARAQAGAAIARAEQLNHPLSAAVAHAYAALLGQFMRDRSMMLEHAAKATEVCTRYGVIYYREWGPILAAWDRSERAPGEESVAEIRRGLHVLRTLNAYPRRAYYLGLLAQALMRAGRVEEARATLDAALAYCAQSQEQWWSAELHRLRGEIADAPDTWFQQALEIARAQGAKSLELRAAVSLVRLKIERGEETAARGLLAPIYEWFTEGADDADLVEARAILSRL
jgi:DNA-binding SARP family transcriptional activator